ncbi:hypothetical protein CVT25_005611 [Psilocybe cyanescens]|uniref:Uncharacterized protein n=1 Tax=Psilocybe cyanescens TaxID=93625 RepID=A0A409VV16_PSICY|nr:hypothetical protein CVT25_005611 [Psilocybe cyanescens]
MEARKRRELPRMSRTDRKKAGNVRRVDGGGQLGTGQCGGAVSCAPREGAQFLNEVDVGFSIKCVHVNAANSGINVSSGTTWQQGPI